MDQLLNLSTKRPRECSERELADFAALIREGGEIDADGLAKRISVAARLFFLHDETGLIGTAALKHPMQRYRSGVAERARVALNEDSYPYELGWIFIATAARRRGHAATLVSSALDYVGRCGVFATTRCNNDAMRLLLERNGFKQVGVEYCSKDGNRKLCLFVTAPMIGSP